MKNDIIKSVIKITNNTIAIIFIVFLFILFIKLIKNGFDIYIIKQPKSPNGIIVSRHILPFILNFLLL